MADRSLIVKIIADTQSLERGFLRSAKGATTLGRDMKSLAVDAKASARVQVDAAVKTDARLRQEIQAYRAVASASARGSREQVAAANLAARAERNLARSLGVTGREQRALAASANHAERNLGRATRGALAGSGVFRGLGRSIAFASGGFLAFASAGQFLRTSIDAAKEAQVTQAQLAAQFRASGKNLGDYQSAIDKTANRLALLAGIENDELKAGFITIFRTTNDVSKSLRDMATAADLARAKHLSFAQASLIVAKTEAGNTTLLRRQAFQIAKNATAEQALAQLRRAVAGQAQAGTTAQERFGAVLHNTEEIIGGALLPQLNRYLQRASVWLTNMNDSGRLQKEVNEILGTTGAVLGGVKTALGPVVTTFKNLRDVVGGVKHETELLIGVWGAFKLAGLIRSLGGLAAAFSGVAAAEAAAAGGAGAVGAGGALLGGRIASALRGALKVGGPASAFVVGEAGTSPRPTHLGGPRDVTVSPLPGNREAFVSYRDPIDGALRIVKVKQGGNVGAAVQADILKRYPELARPSATLTRPVRRGVDVPSRFAPPGTTTTPAKFTTPKPLSLTGQFNLAELRLARAELTKTTADDKQILLTEASIVRQQIAHTKSLKDRTSLTQKLVGILGQINGLETASVATNKKSTAELKQQHVALLANRAAALQAAQFKALGLDATGASLVPGQKALKRELGSVSDAVSGTFLDTSKTRSVLARIRRVLGGGLGALSKDVRSTVKQMLDDLDQQLKDHKTGPETAFQKADTSKLLAGLGLSPAEFRAVRARLSQVGAGGTVPRGSAGAPAFAGTSGTIVVESKLILDGRQVATNTTKHQQRRSRRNPGQRRGPHAGQ